MSRRFTIGLAILGLASGVGCGAAPTDSLGGAGQTAGPTGDVTNGTTTGSTGTGTDPATGTGSGPGTGTGPGTGPGTGTGPATGTGTDAGTPAPAGIKAKDYYIASVYPALATACGSCHGSGAAAYPQFMTTDATTSYAKLDSFGGMIVSKESSKLPNHGAHTGPDMAAALKTSVGTWLDLEVKERGIKTGGPTADQVMTQFGSCITLAEFTATPAGKSVADIPLIQTNNRGQCQSCHSGGGSNFWASNAVGGAQTDLDNNKKLPFLFKLVSATPNADGTYTFSSAANRIDAKQKAAIACAAANRRDCHPNFPNDISAYSKAIATMTASVAAKMTAGQCGAPPAPAKP